MVVGHPFIVGGMMGARTIRCSILAVVSGTPEYTGLSAIRSIIPNWASVQYQCTSTTRERLEEKSPSIRHQNQGFFEAFLV